MIERTPGPWTLKQVQNTPDTHNWFVQAVATDDGRTVDICRVYPISDDGQVGHESHKNAIAIAALPEVIEHLENIVQHAYEDDTPIEDITADFDRMRTIASTALAKIRGEA